MFKFLDKISLTPLVIAGIFLGLAPFKPAPHAIEKISMLLGGQLNKPIDIFDLLFHLSPIILLLIKLGRKTTNKSQS